MISWFFALATLVCALVAAVSLNFKQVILALWLAGLSAGAVFLTLGVEFLAIVQWILSTVVAVSFLFFATMFGEINNESDKKTHRGIGPAVMAVIAGCGFSGLICFGTQKMSINTEFQPVMGNGLLSLGRFLTEKSLLSLEVLALSLFLVMIGAGVVARPEDNNKKSEKPGGTS